MTKMEWPSRNGTSSEPVEMVGTVDPSLSCVRPGTRWHGRTREGLEPTPTACGHPLRDHERMRYLGEGRYDRLPGPCKHCHCEGFLG